MNFDVRPIWMIAVLCSAGFGFLVLFLRRNYSDYLSRALLYWGVAYLCFGTMFLLFLATGAASDVLVYAVSRTFGAAALGLEYWAIGALKRQKTLRTWAAGPPVLLLVMLIWFTLVQRNPAAALALSNFVFAAMMIRNAFAMALPEERGRRTVDVAAAYSFGALALATLLAAAGYLRLGALSPQNDFHGPLLIYSTVAGVVLEGVLFGVFLMAVAERLNEEFKVQAVRDSLTGLYSRQAFEEIGQHEISGATRSGAPLSVFLVDIDRFQQFNDRYGYTIGDFILKSTARALQNVLREEDYLCRWGSDEFCALLRRASREDAEKVARRTLAAMRALDITVQGKPVRVEVSIGIVTREGEALALPSLLKLADGAVSQAKENGRNQFAMV